VYLVHALLSEYSETPEELSIYILHVSISEISLPVYLITLKFGEEVTQGRAFVDCGNVCY
jgi:hypothetical protein